MTKDRIIQAVLRYLEGSAVSLIAECSDYEAARDVLDKLEKIDKATGKEKWFLAVDHCQRDRGKCSSSYSSR